MYLVFDVGATFIKYALMTAEGEIIEKNKIKTPMEDDDRVEDFVAAVGKVFDEYKKNETICGIAMGLPGQIDVKKGIVYNGGGLRYLHEKNVQQLLEDRCDNTPVSLENDGKCAALAEVWKGNAKDVKDACVLVFGTGIGGALIKDRKVIHGKHLLAGELSYAMESMTREELENLPEGEGLMEQENLINMVEKYPYTWSPKSSTYYLCYWVAKKKGLSPDEVTGEKIYQWEEEGDADTIEVLEETYFSIAKYCISLYVIFDPEVILIGGGISAQPKFVQGIQKYVEKLKKLSNVYKDIKIDSCKYLNDSNLLGALYNFKQKYSA